MRLFLVVLFLSLGSVGAQGQESLDHGRLFKVEAPGVAPSYVFGTFHSSAPEILALPPAVKQAFAESTTYVMEVLSDPALMAQLMGRALLPKGRSLHQLLGEDDFGQLVEALDAYGLPSYAVDRMEPWLLLTVLAVSPEEMARQQQGAVLLDVWLEQEAGRQGKSLVGLEVAEEQIRILRDLPRWLQAAALVGTVKLQEKGEVLQAEMTALYLEGDVTGLLAKMRETFGSGFMGWISEQRLLIVRNHRMAERAKPLLDQGGIFIAVGAGHLGGEEGLLQLLRNMGYKVSRAD